MRLVNQFQAKRNNLLATLKVRKQFVNQFKVKKQLANQF